MAGHRTACVPARISKVSQIGPEQISRKIVSCEPDQRHPPWADFAKKLSPVNGVQGISAISRKIALLGVMSTKLAKWVAKKWGPTCDRDISDSAIYTTAIYRAYTVFRFLNLSIIEYIIQKRYVSSSIFLYHDMYLDDCIMLYCDTWCVVSPLKRKLLVITVVLWYVFSEWFTFCIIYFYFSVTFCTSLFQHVQNTWFTSEFISRDRRINGSNISCHGDYSALGVRCGWWSID